METNYVLFKTNWRIPIFLNLCLALWLDHLTTQLPGQFYSTAHKKLSHHVRVRDES